jgi:guanylate kinase
MLVMSSPSGAGKTSLSRRLVADFAQIALSISCTTRAPRPGEQDGREYHFISPADFEAKVAEGAFLEWAEVHDHRYGTLRAPVMAALSKGQDVLFDIDWQGCRQIDAEAGEDVVKVFILPPSLPDLRQRLHARAQDSDAVIARRLERAKGEIAHFIEYDYVIINDDFDDAYAQLVHIYCGEQQRRTRRVGLQAFVAGLMAESA